jgi:hypothetical protein
MQLQKLLALEKLPTLGSYFSTSDKKIKEWLINRCCAINIAQSVLKPFASL